MDRSGFGRWKSRGAGVAAGGLVLFLGEKFVLVLRH